jgi:phage terminase large subunit
VRKTRESLSETGLFTFETYVLGREHPLVIDGKPQRRFRQVYSYPNGAQIVVGGLDKPSKIMSTEYDIVFVQEATELQERDWQALLTRLRNNALPYQQLIADCNPDAPTHWLYLRCLSDAAQLLHSHHEDNPRLYDDGEWTPEGRDYLAKLDSLTGTEHERLRWGKWVQASGLVYDMWSDDNVTADADYTPGAGPVLWGVDDGMQGERDSTGLYTLNSHPRVFLLAQLRHDGRLCIFAEHHTIKTLSDTQLGDVLALPYPFPDYAAVDKSASDLRARMHQAGVETRNSPSSVEESIKTLQHMIAPDTNDWRRVLVHPRCKLVRHEMVSYQRHQATGAPIKNNDHAMDALRYLAWTVRYD